MKIAIIGAGIAGLTSAHLLAGDHDVTVYEAEDWIGGHTHTIRVPTGTGTIAVDTGFIVMNDRNYPSFTRLLGRLGVATQPSNMSFSVSDGSSLEYSSTSIAGLFANPRHAVSPRFLRMIGDVRRFQREARELLEEPGAGPSLRDYLTERHYSREFVEHLLVPQAAAVWSSDPAQMSSFPAKFMIRFFANHGMLQLRNRPAWSVVRGGSHAYVKALTDPLGDRVRARTPVTCVRRQPGGGGAVEVEAGGESAVYDRVILATHSDQALRLLAEPTDQEREVLGAIAYQPNEVVLHTDASLLPRRRAAWASWNYHLTGATGASKVTYHMNRLQSLPGETQYCVTLNHTARIAPERILGRWTYHHPVYTPAAIAAQGRRAEIDGVDRIHYCGAYWGWGFHEDGVVSALRTCETLGGRL